MSREFVFDFGPLSEPLEEQANMHGFTLGTMADILQQVLFGLQYSYVHDVLTYYQFRKATEKFYTKLLKPELCKLKKVEGSEE